MVDLRSRGSGRDGTRGVCRVSGAHVSQARQGAGTRPSQQRARSATSTARRPPERPTPPHPTISVRPQTCTSGPRARQSDPSNGVDWPVNKTDGRIATVATCLCLIPCFGIPVAALAGAWFGRLQLSDWLAYVHGVCVTAILTVVRWYRHTARVRLPIRLRPRRPRRPKNRRSRPASPPHSVQPCNAVRQPAVTDNAATTMATDSG